MVKKLKSAEALLRKLGATFFAVCLCISMTPVTAFADQSFVQMVEESIQTALETVDFDSLSVIEDEEVPQADMTYAPQSEFTVAMIGGTEYETLQSAIDAAENGALITMFLDSAEYLVIENKNITIDLNGHTIIKTDNYSDQGTSSVITVNSSNVVFKGDGLITGDKRTVNIVQTSQVTSNGVTNVVTKVTNKSVNTNKGYRVITAQDSNIVLDGPSVINYFASSGMKEVVDTTYGGTIYVKNGNLTVNKGTISGNDTFGYNYTSRTYVLYGLAVAVRNGNFTMTDGVIEGTKFYSTSSGSTKGACVYVDRENALAADGSRNQVKISGGTLNNSKSTKANMGGNLYAFNCDVEISGEAKILNGQATYGGNVYVTNGVLSMSGGTVSGGSSSNGGGGIAISGNASRFVMSGGVIENNKCTATSTSGAGVFIGAIYTAPTMEMTGGTIANNISNGDGGGISVYSSSSIQLKGGVISGNQCGSATLGKFGAGVYIAATAANANIDLSGVTVVGNRADAPESAGGGVYINATNNDVTLNLGATEITDNYAGFGAGLTLCANSKSVKVNMSSEMLIYGNHATNDANAAVSSGSGASGGSTTVPKNNTDELFFNQAKSVKYFYDDESVANLDDCKFASGITAILYRPAGAVNGVLGNKATIKDAVAYYCEEKCNLTKDQCIDAVVLDPQHVATNHYVWDDETETASLLTEENGLFTELEPAIEEAKKTGKNLIVCSAAEIRNKDIDGKGVRVMRCTAHHETPVLNIVGRVSLTNIIVDGCEVDAGSNPLIKVSNGANVTINKDTEIRNAVRSSASGYSGGAAMEFAWGNGSSKLTINDGVFDKNVATGNSVNGGALWVWNTKVTIDGGTFSRNKASSGGALFTLYDSEVFISGGLFEENIATRGEGGALAFYSLSGLDTGWHPTNAVISGGSFIANESHRPVIGEYYSGGAIYNNFFCNLTILNALITENYITPHSGIDQYVYGGLPCDHEAAVGNCRVGTMEIYKVEGALIYNNKKKDNWKDHNADVSFCGLGCTRIGGQPTHDGYAMISDYALGGGDCNWTDYSGNPVSGADYQDVKTGFALYSNPDEKTIEWAEDHATTLLEGNTAYGCGTAIANNGNLTFGSEKKNIEVTKEWKELDDEGNLVDMTETPESVRVQLAYFEAGKNEPTPVSTETRKDAIQVLNAGNEWTAFWGDLGTKYNWTIVELDNPGFTWKLSDPTERLDDVIPVSAYTLTNTWNDERTNVSVEKFWNDNNAKYSERPKTVELTLKTSLGADDQDGDGKISVDEYKDYGTPVTVTENADGKWRWEFKGLPKYTKHGDIISYYVKETPVKDYTSEISDGEYHAYVEQVEAADGSLTWLDGDGNEWSAFNVTNAPIMGKLDIEKSWSNYNENGELTLPESIDVEVYYRGDIYATVTLTGADGWKLPEPLEVPLNGEITVKEKVPTNEFGLDIYDVSYSYSNGGDIIVFTAPSEDANDSSIGTATISNVILPTESQITISKSWENYDPEIELADELIPDSINVNISIKDANGNEEVRVIELTGPDWSQTIGVPLKSEVSVSEDELDGYEVSYSYNGDGQAESLTLEGRDYTGAIGIVNTKIKDPEFGKLSIVKNVEGSFSAIDGGNIGSVTAVFHIVGTAEDDDGNEVTVYDQYAGLTFAADGDHTQRIDLDNLPLGTYTVEEVQYDGAGYVPADPNMATQTVVLGTKVGPNNEDQLDMTVEFTNNTNGDKPSSGIVNRYEFTPGEDGTNPLLAVVRYINGVLAQND